jgi:hypothetical protein
MKQHYENYRTWVLHEWTLQGDQREWGRQLRERYAREPVFALIAGVSDADWSAVHEFSAEFKVPVVLPQTPLPPSDVEDPFYSLYFSRGVALEAETLATHLAGGREAPVSIVQVARCGTAGDAAARALAARLGPGVDAARVDCLAPGVPLDHATWNRLLQRRATTAVLWLSADDLPGLRTLADDPRPLQAIRSVYVSSTLLGEEAERLSGELGRRGLLLQPFVPAADFAQQLWRAMAWFRANRIDPPDRRVATNTLFAMTLVADVLMIPRTLASREYFIERIEHMASQSPNRSAYPTLSFDAVRRFGTDECSVLRLPVQEAASSGR